MNHKKLREWQNELMNIIRQEPERRDIYWIYDPIGNVGKTFFGSYVGAMYPEQILSIQSSNGKEVLYKLCSMTHPRALLLDVARCKKGIDLSYDVIEQVKAGNLLSIKYIPIQRNFTPMHVMVFSNSYPDINKLSIDRWKICEIMKSDITEDHYLKWLNDKDIQMIKEINKINEDDYS